MQLKIWIQDFESPFGFQNNRNRKTQRPNNGSWVFVELVLEDGAQEGKEQIENSAYNDDGKQ